MQNSLIRNPRIAILVGSKPSFARVYSGVGIMMIWANDVSAKILRECSGTIRQTDAFGRGVTARLLHVILGLRTSSESVAQPVKIMMRSH